MPHGKICLRRAEILLLMLLALFGGAQRAVAQRPAVAPDTVDRYILAEMARQHIPGASLAITRAGKITKVAGYGVADLENNIAVTPASVFKIGSLSKQFLAAGILLLAEERRLNIDDPVSKFYPTSPDSWRGITLRHFLTHTSGVVREGPAFDGLLVQPDSVVVKSAFAKPLDFTTGSKYQYCNVCYFALADVITRVTGQPWDAFVAERIFQPAGMTSTRTTSPKDLVPGRARGYVWREGRYENAPEYLALRPSGAFLSTVLDLAKWDAALYSDRVLSKQRRDQMWTQYRLSDGTYSQYGFGWAVDSLDGHWRVRHGGALPGFRSEIARLPNDSITVILLTNADDAQPGPMVREIARMLLAENKQP